MFLQQLQEPTNRVVALLLQSCQHLVARVCDGGTAQVPERALRMLAQLVDRLDASQRQQLGHPSLQPALPHHLQQLHSPWVVVAELPKLPVNMLSYHLGPCSQPLALPPPASLRPLETLAAASPPRLERTHAAGTAGLLPALSGPRPAPAPQQLARSSWPKASCSASRSFSPTRFAPLTRPAGSAARP
eukprot:756684-Hanusia_phi.AAC.1